jgi:hypothetical protein
MSIIFSKGENVEKDELAAEIASKLENLQGI